MTTLLAGALPALACSPPLPLWLGEKGPQVPFQYPSYFAFVGEVLGHTTTAAGDPALSLRVVDAWSPRQERGQVVTIGVAQWRGCGLDKPMGKAFRPEAYPVGTRVRLISRDETMFTWDVDSGILVLGSGV